MNAPPRSVPLVDLRRRRRLGLRRVAGELDGLPRGRPPPRGWLPRDCGGIGEAAAALQRLAVLVEDDVRRLARHHVVQLPRLLADVRRVLPAPLLPLQVADARLAQRDLALEVG